MELIELWSVIKKRWIMIVLITLIAALTAGVLSKFVLTKQYASSNTLMVIPKGSAGLYTDLVTGQQLTTTYATLATSATVLGNANHQLGLGMSVAQLTPMIKAVPGTSTDLVTITATSTNPITASRLANAVGHQTVLLVTKAEGVKSLQSVTPATPDFHPVSPNTKENVAIALVLGLLVSSGIAFLLEYFDDSFKREEDVKRVLALPALVTIPHIATPETAGSSAESRVKAHSTRRAAVPTRSERRF